MSISTTSTKDSYAGNASITTQYPITFKYLEESHVSVYIDGVLQTKGAGADYVMGGDGTANTGYITTNVAQADTKTITIVLDFRNPATGEVELDQPVALQETGVLSSSTLEEAYDRLNMQIRRVWRKVGDVLTFSTDEGGSSTGTADTLIGFDNAGDIEEVAKSTFVESSGGINNISDVTITAPSNGEGLIWNGLAWVNSSTGLGDALTTSSLSQFASTTSAEFAGVISDETGTGSVVLATSPTLVTPALGTPSAIDLTNATNTPLPASGTVTEAMLNASVNASLDLADTAIQTETNGTVQGTNGTYDIQAVASNDLVTPNARGEGSIDLQMERTLATEVASGARSVLIGGKNNTASAVSSAVLAGDDNTANAQYAVVAGGTNNTASGNNSFVMGGYGNSATGARGTVLVGANSTAGQDALAVGNSVTSSHNGAKMFGDHTATAFASKGNAEFGVQCDNFRVDVGTPAVGQVLTCNNADGSSGWASPAKVVYTVATLPATPAQGDVAMVTDATATTFHSVVAGTGSNVVPVFYDGTNWRIG